MTFTRTRVISFLVAIGVSITASVLFAAVNFHNVTCTQSGLAVSCEGKISGLGNDTYTVSVSATGPATSTCTSPGGNEAPGQQPANVTSAGSTSITPDDSDTSGNYGFAVQGGTPPNPSAKAAGCPNNNWKAKITSVDYTTATVTVRLGSTILKQGTFPVN